jgi:hypothetical protein
MLVSFSAFAAIPETMYDLGEATYNDAELDSVAEYFRANEKINVLFKNVELGKKKVTLRLKKVPKYVILLYAARAAGLQCTYKGYGAVIEKAIRPYQSRNPAGAFVATLHKKIAFDMTDPSLDEVLQMLSQVHGVNIVFINPEKWADKKITSLKLKKVSILQLLNYLSELYNVPVTLDKYAAFVGEKKQKPVKKPVEGKGVKKKGR